MNTIKAKVIMLPTGDITGIVMHSTGLDKIVHTKESELKAVLTIGGVSQHLYITSDQEIKEGDYYFDGTDFVHRKSEYNKDLVDGNKDARKIVATTDTSLNLPQMSQEFLKEYCEAGGKIEEVEIESEKEYQVEDFYTREKRWVKYSEYSPEEYMTINSTYFLKQDKLRRVFKVDSNNCVIVHSIKEKLYTREELKNAFNSAREFNSLDGIIDIHIIADLPRDLSPKYTTVEDWIRENL